MMPDVTAVIETDSLTKRFGTHLAVDGLTLSLAPGSITGFLGPNGAGKSTTLRLLVGLLRPTSGGARLFGEPPAKPSARRRLGYLPADATFDRRLSGTANLDVLAALRGPLGAIDRATVAEALGMTRRDLDRPVKEYSGGMRQKLGLIAAMQHRPDVLILDEPANRLDPLVHRTFCELLRSSTESGRAVLLSSHVLGEVDEVCDQVALIREGRLIRLADVAAIRQQAQRRITVTYRRPHPASAVLSSAVACGDSVTGRIPAGRPDLVRALLDDPDVTDIEVQPPSLEDLFMDIYAEAAAT